MVSDLELLLTAVVCLGVGFCIGFIAAHDYIRRRDS